MENCYETMLAARNHKKYRYYCCADADVFSEMWTSECDR